MADVRSMLKNERAARRIQHKYASYTATGTLTCSVCRLSLKSESLWEGHLRSPGHIMKVQKLQEAAGPEEPTSVQPVANSRKRSHQDDEDEVSAAIVSKRARPTDVNGRPEGRFDESTVPTAGQEMQMPSRPATPSKTLEQIPQRPEPNVDEDEWAAFEAEIATEERKVLNEDDGTVISAPAMTVEQIKQRSAEEEYNARKERQEAEIEGDKEDAARKMEVELEEMEGLEQRVKRLREKMEKLKKGELVPAKEKQVTTVEDIPKAAEESEDDEEDEDDDWGVFRMKR